MGSLGVVPNFGQIYNPDSFTGDGSNTTFTLSHGVTSDQSILWIESGVVQKPGIDYTISGLTLTRTTAPANLVACFAMYLGVSVDVGTIGDASVTLAKMAVNSIDSDQYVDASIDNAHLADDAVGVAELSATGTASSSTFLRGDNAWAAASGGAWTVIQKQTASASSSIDFTSGIGSTYDRYCITADRIVISEDAQFRIAISDDSGSSWEAGSTDYGWAYHGLDIGGAVLSGNSGTSLTSYARFGDTWNASITPASFVMWFTAPDESGTYEHTFELQGNYPHATDDDLTSLHGTILFSGTTIFDGVRLYLDTDTLTVGTFTLYGIKNT